MCQCSLLQTTEIDSNKKNKVYKNLTKDIQVLQTIFLFESH